MVRNLRLIEDFEDEGILEQSTLVCDTFESETALYMTQD